MNQLEAMQIYVRVADLASFTQAAESMGIAKASVSAAVRQLEGVLGTRLLHRTTRKVQMTQDGQVFYERCKDLLADVDEIQTLFHKDPASLRGRLRVDMPLAVARDVLVPNLPDFLSAHPELEIELSSTDRKVDLIREGFDCVLRVGVLSDSSLIARSLGEYVQINCASPDYLARYGEPKTLADLAGHRLVHYVSTLGGRSSGFEYVDSESANRVVSVQMPGALTVNNSVAYLSACLSGLGVVQTPEFGLKPYFESGQLVEILPDFRAEPMPVWLIYSNRRHLPRRVQAFMNWFERLMKECLSTGRT